MADNRMYLVHRPTGLAIHLGNRMSFGWYTTSEEIPIHKLFGALGGQQYAFKQDDFAIAMENARDAPMAIGGWMRGEPRDDGLIQMIMP